MPLSLAVAEPLWLELTLATRACACADKITLLILLPFRSANPTHKLAGAYEKCVLAGHDSYEMFTHGSTIPAATTVASA